MRRIGLDVSPKLLTGPHAVYRDLRSESSPGIMFHVANLIASNGLSDPTRKRHIGNDVVVVVFNESGGPFDPTQVLRSHFTHVYIVVTKTLGQDTDATYYEVEVFARSGVANVPPYLPSKQPFKKTPEFEEWFIAKSTAFVFYYAFIPTSEFCFKFSTWRRRRSASPPTLCACGLARGKAPLVSSLAASSRRNLLRDLRLPAVTRARRALTPSLWSLAKFPSFLTKRSQESGRAPQATVSKSPIVLEYTRRRPRPPWPRSRRRRRPWCRPRCPLC